MGDHDRGRVRVMGRPAARRWVWLTLTIAGLVMVSPGFGPAVVHAGAGTYDGPSAAGAVARVDVGAAGTSVAATPEATYLRHRSASQSIACRGASTTSSVFFVATNTADDAARFVVDSAGNTTLRAQGPSGWIDVTSHAAKRMTQRGTSIADVDQALTQTPFNYWHNNTWKVGYYDPGTNVFVGTVNGVATTVITPSAGPQYVANLLAAAP